MCTVTNYIVKTNNGTNEERYILPQFRDRMNELERREEELGYEPLLVVGKDGKWWSDDLFLTLDRVSGYVITNTEIKGGPLNTWAQSILDNPLMPSEVRLTKIGDTTFVVLADTSDLSDDGKITNNTEVVEDDEVVVDDNKRVKKFRCKISKTDENTVTFIAHSKEEAEKKIEEAYGDGWVIDFSTITEVKERDTDPILKWNPDDGIALLERLFIDSFIKNVNNDHKISFTNEKDGRFIVKIEFDFANFYRYENEKISHAAHEMIGENWKVVCNDILDSILLDGGLDPSDFVNGMTMLKVSKEYFPDYDDLLGNIKLTWETNERLWKHCKEIVEKCEKVKK